MAKKRCHTNECGQKCDGDPKRLGLCDRCYDGIRIQVNDPSNPLTWEAVFNAGLALRPHDKSRSKNPAVRALAEAGLLAPAPQPSTEP